MHARSRFLPAVMAAFIAFSPDIQAETHDLLLIGGEVMDGTGTPAYRADVAVTRGIITAIGDLSQDNARRKVDVTGRIVVPGFIDVHSHADGANDRGLRSRDERRRAAPNLVAQGITTVVTNQDGRSPESIKRQRQQMARRGIGPNAILMVGHNSIRQKALGSDYKRAATRAEVAEMVKLVREGMDEGAWGLTAGLEYTPGIWSETEEVIALVRAVKPHGGVYIVHERASGQDPMWFLPSQHEADQPSMLDNIHEQIRIARETGVTTVATHIKARGENFWGSSEAIINAIDAARAEGVPIFADQYPYNTSGSDGAIVLIPRWILDEYGKGKRGKDTDYAGILEEALINDDTRARIEGDVAHMITRRGNPDHIIVFDHPNEDYIGKSLAELAFANEKTPIEMVFALQFDGYHDRFGGARIRGYSMSEKDIEAFSAQPWCLTASDAGIALPDDPPVHARYYGTFPRKIFHYALTRNVLSVEDAVRSMTSLPAEVMGLKNRGVIAAGNAADITVLDLARIRDNADFFEPHQYPSGVHFVFVNGAAVVESGRLTYGLHGEVLTPKDAAAGP